MNKAQQTISMKMVMDLSDVWTTLSSGFSPGQEGAMFLCPFVWQNGLQASNSLQRCWLLLNKVPHWFKSSRLLATRSTTEPPDRGCGQQKFTSMPSESCFMSQRQPRREVGRGKMASCNSKFPGNTLSEEPCFSEGEFYFAEESSRIFFVICRGKLK